MSARFFNPYVGAKYRDGLGNNKYSVLVLGASVYCTYDGKQTYKGKKKERCHYFEECTSEYIKDSSPFNKLCPHPEWDSNGEATPLEDFPIHVCSGTMTRFSNKLESRFEEILDRDSIWNRIAFTEYVQYFLNHQRTCPDDLSDRDFEAFIETLDKLRPNIVIVWGNVVADVLRESEYSVEIDDDAPWDFAWKYDDMFIRFICCTHPASGNFTNNFPEFANRFEKTISYC